MVLHSTSGLEICTIGILKARNSCVGGSPCFLSRASYSDKPSLWRRLHSPHALSMRVAGGAQVADWSDRWQRGPAHRLVTKVDSAAFHADLLERLLRPAPVDA